MNVGRIISTILLLVMLTGCAQKRVTYSVTGGVVGGGIGYAINKDPKDAAIGGLAGTGAGYIIGDIQDKKDNKKYQEAYEKGYSHAQTNIAVQYWDSETGRKEETGKRQPIYKRIKIPKKEINGVVYEEHYETVEVWP
jgi:hypothetical protein